MKFIFFCLTIFFVYACNQQKNDPAKPVAEAGPDSTNYFPVTNFLRGQLHDVQTIGVTPLKIFQTNKGSDSTWLTLDDFEKEMQPFLTPEIDTANMKPFFSQESFFDGTLNLFTFSYTAKPNAAADLKGLQWTVYTSPYDDQVKQIYIEKEHGKERTQLTWFTGKRFEIRKIDDDKVQEKISVIWKFTRDDE